MLEVEVCGLKKVSKPFNKDERELKKFNFNEHMHLEPKNQVRLPAS